MWPCIQCLRIHQFVWQESIYVRCPTTVHMPLRVGQLNFYVVKDVMKVNDRFLCGYYVDYRAFSVPSVRISVLYLYWTQISKYIGLQPQDKNHCHCSFRREIVSQTMVCSFLYRALQLGDSDQSITRGRPCQLHTFLRKHRAHLPM